MAELYRNAFYLSPDLGCLFSRSTLQVHDVNVNFEKYMRVTHDEAVIEKMCNFLARKDDKDYFESVVRALSKDKVHHELDEIELIVGEGTFDSFLL